MVTRTQICRRDLPRESWTTVQVRLIPAHDAGGRADIWLNGAFCGAYRGPICGRPPSRKVLAAVTGLVGCGHMSGLCGAVG
jgi:hypothetical protein